MTEVATKTAHEAFIEMEALVESTHWMKSQLMCVVNEVDGIGKQIFDHWEEDPQYGRYPVYKKKETYCLVGLVVKVTVDDPCWREDEDLYQAIWPEGNDADYYDHIPKSSLIQEMLDTLYDQIHLWWPFDPSPEEKDHVGHKIGRIEQWNDYEETTRSDVLKLVRECVNVTRPKEMN